MHFLKNLDIYKYNIDLYYINFQCKQRCSIAKVNKKTIKMFYQKDKSLEWIEFFKIPFLS